ncbi:MAG: Abi family protein [Alcaligenaceae bacterium]|nr:Abi family protein [Alcaligenaceae bacterium]
MISIRSAPLRRKTHERVFFFVAPKLISTYSKPYLSFQQQLALLKARGLEVHDNATALAYLNRIGYYRLSAYWYPLRVPLIIQDQLTQKIEIIRQDQFKSGSSFEHALKLYVFDKRLRLLLLDAIERVEVAIRVDIADTLGARDTFAHINSDMLHGSFTKKVKSSGQTAYQEWLQKYNMVLARSKDDFFKHCKRKYGLPLPIWISVEIWDFGMLSMFYQGMQAVDKSSIAAKYDIQNFQVMESWLRALNFVRNVAAHHSRLWNKNLVDQPKFPKLGEIVAFDPIVNDLRISNEVGTRLYGVVCILIHLLKVISPNSSWRDRLRQMIDQFPPIPSLCVADMGFPQRWQEHDFWR